jgi:hypothetical protein
MPTPPEIVGQFIEPAYALW